MFACEYCFCHYINIGILFLTQFRLFHDDWRGYVIAGFCLVWIANIYSSLFSIIRLDIKKEKMEITEKEDDNK